MLFLPLPQSLGLLRETRIMVCCLDAVIDVEKPIVLSGFTRQRASENLTRVLALDQYDHEQ